MKMCVWGCGSVCGSLAVVVNGGAIVFAWFAAGDTLHSGTVIFVP